MQSHEVMTMKKRMTLSIGKTAFGGLARHIEQRKIRQTSGRVDKARSVYPPNSRRKEAL
jgi:hypothetical protein